jgi:hypothetical protein
VPAKAKPPNTMKARCERDSDIWFSPFGFALDGR